MSEKADEVLRFDTSLVKKLQGELGAARDEREEIIRGSRLYWQRVQAVHEAALLLLDATGLADMQTLLSEDISCLLGFDCALLLFERLGSDGPASLSPVFRAIPSALAGDAFMAQDVAVVEDMPLLQALFPELSGLLAFALCLPLKAGARRGLLVLGQRNAQYLSVGQALEPYVFLARVVERLGRKWLATP